MHAPLGSAHAQGYLSNPHSVEAAPHVGKVFGRMSIVIVKLWH